MRWAGARSWRGWITRANLLLTAGFEAWQQSGWEPSDHLPLVLGTTAGGMASGEELLPPGHPGSRQLTGDKPPAPAHYQAQMQARALAEASAAAGPITILSNACAAGANAIGHAWELVRSGSADRVLTGGYEALSQLLVRGVRFAPGAVAHRLPAL